MAFNLLSKTRSPLTYSRENAILRHSLSSGVYSGMQVYPDAGTVDFQISIFGGYCVIAGALVYEDEDRTEILDLGSPVDATGDHHLIWVDLSTGTPEYKAKTGTYASPASLSPSEADTGVVLANVYIPAGATDINDADVIISNVPSVMSNADLTKIAGRHIDFTCEKVKVLESSGVYSLHVLNGKCLSLNPFKQPEDGIKRLPLVVHDIESASASAEYVGGFKVDVDINGATDDEYVLFYIREPDFWTDNSSPLDIVGVSFRSDDSNMDVQDIQALIGNAVDPVTAIFPNRSEFANVFVLAIVDVANAAVIMPKWTMEVGVEYENGSLNTYTQSLSSTVYGTGPVTPGATGDIDIDSVISNASKLVNATLDTAYDGFGAAAAEGSGASITVDASPVTLVNVNIDDPTGKKDKFRSALRIVIDDDGYVDEAEYEESGLEGYYPSDKNSTRRVVSTIEAANINGAWANGTSVTWDVDGGGRIVLASALGSVTLNSFYQEYGFFHWHERFEELLISFADSGADCDDKIYRVRYEILTDTMYLEDVDGDPGTTALSADFPALPASIKTYLWESKVSISPKMARFQDVNLTGSLRGPGGNELRLDQDTMVSSGWTMEEFITRSATNETALLGEIDTLGEVDVLVSSNAKPIITTDGVYVYQLQRTIAGSPVSVGIYSCSGGPMIKAIASTSNSSDVSEGLCGAWEGRYLWIAFDDILELWSLETDTMLWSATLGFHINDLVVASGVAFVAHNHDGVTPANISVFRYSSPVPYERYRPVASVNMIKLDVHNGHLVCSFDGAKSGLVVADIRDVSNIVTIDSRLFGSTSDSYVEDILDVAVGDGYIAVCGHNGSGSLDLFYVETYNIGNLVDPIAVHAFSANDFGDILVPGTIRMFPDKDKLWVVYRDSSYSGILALDWRTGEYMFRQLYDIAATNKTFQGSACDGRNIYITDVHASNDDLLRVKMGKTRKWYNRRALDASAPFYKIAAVEV